MHFDNTISIGNVLTVIAVLAGWIAFIQIMRFRLDRLENKHERLESRLETSINSFANEAAKMSSSVLLFTEKFVSTSDDTERLEANLTELNNRHRLLERDVDRLTERFNIRAGMFEAKTG